MATCEHTSFMAKAAVTRLTDGDDGPVTGYHVDLQVHCTECGEQFRFIGLPLGSSPVSPTASVDRTEARLPIEPASAACDA